jgi:hypothetical protein
MVTERSAGHDFLTSGSPSQRLSFESLVSVCPEAVIASERERVGRKTFDA